MAPRFPIPINPLDILNALRVLPGMARDTASMAKSTEVLGEVAKSVSALPELRAEMARVAKATEEISKIDGRMATIEAAMPVLVEVQQHLSQLPEIMLRLNAQLDDLSTGLEELQSALLPIGRLARRMPGSRRAERQAAEQAAE
jgi:uncharacterized phage infection (PIP) family protein YhgE